MSFQSLAKGNFSAQKSVVVVGSGIAGLMTAYHAVEAGYHVRVLSKSPDPRYAAPGTVFESSTWDGYVNRCITLTEGHPYLDLPGYLSAMYPEIAEDFRTDLTQGGVLVRPLEDWDRLSQQFLQERDRANKETNHIFRLFHQYVDENRASMEMWYNLLTELLLRKPNLLNNLSLHSRGIDRFYDQKTLFDEALWALSRQGIVKDSYSVEELLRSPDFHPYQAGLQTHAFIQGGGLTLYGLAFNVQAFASEWLFCELETRGVELCLGAEYDVIGLEKDGLGTVIGVKTRNGMLHCAKHIFLHPGAYMHPHILEGTDAYGKLAGVKGLWMRIKNAQDLFGPARHAPRPTRIHGGKYDVTVAGQTYRGQVTDLNVMPKLNSDGSWELVIGSGYLFVGVYPFAGDTTLGEPLADAAAEHKRQQQIKRAEEIAVHAFVQVVSQVYSLDIDVDAVLAGRDERIDIPSKGCMRSWSPNDRELRVILPTTNQGIALVDGGGNTGSTTKAPFIAKAAIDFVRSLDHLGGNVASLTTKQLIERYEVTRQELSKTRGQLSSEHWQELERSLNQAVTAAKIAQIPLLLEQFRTQPPGKLDRTP